jgi:PhnB protein
MPAAMRDKILHGVLTSGKMVLMGSDMVGEEGYKPGNTISLCLICDSKVEIDRLFSQLSEGGRVRHPLKGEFFGTFGDLTDRYGFNWMLMFGGEQKK